VYGPPQTASDLHNLRSGTSLASLDVWELKGQTVGVTGIRGIVRRATSEDLHAVLELDRIAPVGHERGPLLTARVQSGEVILFEHEGRVSGYAVVRPQSFFGCDFVELLAVAAGDRRHGVGGLLLQQAVGLSSTKRIFTSTNRSNAQMIGLLEKEGWQFSGQLEGIDEGDPELVYYKDSA
jgi:GNAT superfamily N-acetyltransferase